MLEVYAGTITLDVNASLQADFINDEIHIRPTCAGYNCTMFFGEHNTAFDTWHLTDAEFDRISTSGVLQIGDRNTNDIGFIHFRGVSYDSGEDLIMVQAHHPTTGKIEFSGAKTTFLESIEFSAYGDLIVNSTVEFHDAAKVRADSDCYNSGYVLINGYLDSSSTSEPLIIWGGGIEIEEGSEISAGEFGKLWFSERCNSYDSVGIGDIVERNETMYFTQAETDMLTALDIQFDSYMGSITIYGIDHPNTHMTNVTRTVQLVSNSSGGQVNFSYAFAAFNQLLVEGLSGINFEYGIDLFTRQGWLELEFHDGDIIMQPHVDVSASGGDLILTSRNAMIYTHVPGSFSTTHDTHIYRNISIERADITMGTKFDAFQFLVDGDLHCSSIIRFDGVVPDAHHWSIMHMMAGTINLDESCRIVGDQFNDDLHVYPSCENLNCKMYFGAYPEVNDSAFHLTDAELDRIMTYGTLHFGDWNSTLVDHIEIRNISHVQGHNGVFFHSHHPINGSIVVRDHATFSEVLELSAAGSVYIHGDLYGYEPIKLVADFDCNLTTDAAIIITGLVDTTTNNSDIQLWGGSMDITGFVDAALGNIEISEKCHHDLSMGIGGYIEGDERLALSRAELDHLYSYNITFDSRWGNIWVYGLEHPDVNMFGVTQSVYINALNPSKRITFERKYATFREVFVEAAGGIEIFKNISTTDGHLRFTWDTGDLTSHWNVTLSATGGNLEMVSNTSEVYANAPGRFESTTHDFRLYRDLNISRGGLFTIKAQRHFEGTKPIHVVDDRISPSYCPTTAPSFYPSSSPSFSPSLSPSEAPTLSPSICPTIGPTLRDLHTRVEFILGTVDVHSSFVYFANSPTDETYLRPSCNSTDCRMFFGDQVRFNETEFHMTDNELDRIITDGMLLIGDRSESTDVDFIEISGITYDSAPIGIEILSHNEDEGKILWTNTPSHIHERLLSSSAGHTIVNTSVKMNTSSWFKVDSDCSEPFVRGTLYITDLGTLDTATRSSNLLIWGGQIDIDTGTGLIDVGVDGNLTFSERCNPGESVGIGGYVPPENMGLSKAELARLTGFRVIFNSLLGNMHVWGMDHPDEDMANITWHAFVIADAPKKQITFANESSIFREVYIECDGGIIIEPGIDITTTEGHLSFTFYNGDLEISEEVDLSATGGDVRTFSKTANIRVQMPVSITSTDLNIMIDRPMIITRWSPSFFNLTAFNSLTMKSEVIVTGNPSPNFHNKSMVKISAGVIDLQSTFSLTSNHTADEIWFLPTCEGTNCRILLGDHPDAHGEFHLTDAEIDRISTYGILRFGDRTYEYVRVDDIVISGVSFDQADIGVYMMALHPENGSIRFLTAASSFDDYFEIVAASDMIFNTTLTLGSDSFLTVDHNCDREGTLHLQDGGHINSPGNLTHVKIHGGSIVLDDGSSISSGLATLTLSERCNADGSLGIGGPIEGPETMALNHDELNRLEAGDIYFESLHGSINSYGFVHPSEHMMNVTGSVHMSTVFNMSNISFYQAHTEVRQLYATAAGGFYLFRDVFSNDGVLRFTWYRGIMETAAEVDVIATGGSLILNGSTSIKSQLPGSLQSMSENLVLQIPLLLVRNRTDGKKFRIRAEQHFHCNNTIDLAANLDTWLEPFDRTYLEIFSSTIEIEHGCNITANDTEDVVHLRPVCGGLDCTILLGGFTEAEGFDKFHLRDDELDRIYTTGRMRIGDRNQTRSIGRINVTGLTFNTSKTEIILSAQHSGSIVHFFRESSYIHDHFIVLASGDIWIEDITVSGSKTIKLWADTYCETHVNYRTWIWDGANVDTSTLDTDITIVGGGFDIDYTSSVNAGNGYIQFLEVCDNDNSFSLGGYQNFNNYSEMSIFRDEMDRLFCSYITFQSHDGHMYVHGFDHPWHNMIGVTGGINLHVFSDDRKIFFLTNRTLVRNMTVTAKGGIYVAEEVRSVGGALWFNWTHGDFILTAGTHIYALYGDIILTSTDSNIHVYAPSSFNAETHSIDIYRSITVHRNISQNATFKLWAQSNFTCSAPIFAIDDASNSSTLLQFKAGTIELYDGCDITANASSDEIHLLPSCIYYDCSMAFGATGDIDEFHLTNKEFNQISTAGFLSIGDRGGSFLVDLIRFDGIEYFSADMGIKIDASWVNLGEIQIINNPVAFTHEVEMVAGGHIIMDTSFTCNSSMLWYTNYDCNQTWVEGTFKLLAGALISTAPFNSDLVLWGGGMEIDVDAGITAGPLGQLYIGERCESNLSITLGGAIEGDGNMSFNTMELDKLKAENIVFESIQGSFKIHGLEHPNVHMSNVTNKTTIIANDSYATVTFLDLPATFRDLEVIGRRGINLHVDVNTTDGAIIFTFDLGDLYLDRYVDLMSVGGEILLSGAYSNIRTEIPASIQATDHNLEFRSDIYITRNPLNTSTLRLKADQALTFDVLVKLVHTGCTEPIYNQLEIIAGTIDIQENGRIESNHINDEIYMRPSCRYTDCRIFLGNHSGTEGQFHLTDAELDRIDTVGELMIGDRLDPDSGIYSREIDQIYIRDVSYDSGLQGVRIRSLFNETGSLDLWGDESWFTNNLILESAGNMSLNNSLYLNSSLHLVVDHGCLLDSTLFIHNDADISTVTYISKIVCQLPAASIFKCHKIEKYPTTSN